MRPVDLSSTAQLSTRSVEDGLPFIQHWRGQRCHVCGVSAQVLPGVRVFRSIPSGGRSPLSASRAYHFPRVTLLIQHSLPGPSLLGA
jgi:hypothetical protein